MKKIFNINKEYNRLTINIFGTKLSFLTNINKDLNRYIPLGTNCFVRVKLSHYGIKPKKKFGEKTCPFDLCVTPIDFIDQILANDFKTYFNHLEYSDDQKMWINPFYKMKYPHDRDIKSKDKFIRRYSDRINNFRKILNSEKDLIFISAVFNKEIKTSTLNNIYESLLKYRKEKAFKFYVFNFNETNENLLIEDETLNKNICYKEFDSDISGYRDKWNIAKYLTIKSEQTVKIIAGMVLE